MASLILQSKWNCPPKNSSSFNSVGIPKSENFD